MNGDSSNAKISNVPASESTFHGTRSQAIISKINEVDQRRRDILKITINSNKGPCVAFVCTEDITRPASGNLRLTPAFCAGPSRIQTSVGWRRLADRIAELREETFPAFDHFNHSATTSPISDHSPYHGMKRLSIVSQALPKLCSLPVEVFEIVLDHVSREDVTNLRKVNKALEKAASRHLFRTVVVPFTKDVYGMLSSQEGIAASLTQKGKSKAMSPILDVSETRVAKALEGLDVFRGFGPHIRKYGMTFDFDLKTLMNPPNKRLQQGHDTFWGNYDWPFPDYSRFEDRAKLENTADETSIMTLAFSHLTQVNHLALSIDSGLGWIKGLDLSTRSQFLKKDVPVFDTNRYESSSQLALRRKFWLLLEKIYGDIDYTDDLQTAELAFMKVDVPILLFASDTSPPSIIIDRDLRDSVAVKFERETPAAIARDIKLETGLPENRQYYIFPSLDVSTALDRSIVGHTIPNILAAAARDRYDIQVEKKIMAQKIIDFKEQQMLRNAYDACNKTEDGVSHLQESKSTSCGLLYLRPRQAVGDDQDVDDEVFNLRCLSEPQKEWLMETSWAQDAFMSSYMLAVTDNRSAFQHLTKFSLCRMSGRHLQKLYRNDFWNAIPSLSDVDILLSPDWRDVHRNADGFVEVFSQDPSDTVDTFYNFLKIIISPRKNIKKLAIGWVDGGEHAEGICSRNRMILPCPLNSKRDCLNIKCHSIASLKIPHVEDITFVNCWLSPICLRAFSIANSRTLKKLTLDSVSLTASPRYAPDQTVNAPPGCERAFKEYLHCHVSRQLASSRIPPGTNIARWMSEIRAAKRQERDMAHVSDSSEHLARIYARVLWGIANDLGVPVPAAVDDTVSIVPLKTDDLNPREDSWADVLGFIGEKHVAAHNADVQVTCLSCGYVKLQGNFFDQTLMLILENDIETYLLDCPQLHWFRMRSSHLNETLVPSDDPFFGKIVSWLNDQEVTVLKNEWNMFEGWPLGDILDEGYDDKGGWGKWGENSKNAAKYDGHPPGGTGRFSGRINGFLLTSSD